MKNINVEKVNYKIFYLIFFPGLLYYYFSSYRIVFFLTYLFTFFIILYNFLLFGQKIKNWLVLSIILLYFTGISISGLFGSLIDLSLALRLNFGCILFMLVFQFIRIPNIEKITSIISSITIFEFVLINIFPVLINKLPNYDITGINLNFGVYSFGGNRTVSGVLLLSLYIYLEKIRSKKILPLIASLLCGAGTTYFLFSLYLIYKNYKNIYISIPVIAILFFILNYKSGEYFLLTKFNYDYILYLIEFKLHQVFQLLSIASTSSLIFGMGDASFISKDTTLGSYGSMFGDFAGLDFIARFGILGAAVLIVSILLLATSSSVLALTFIVLGSMHYHVLFSMPGQIIAGLIVADALKRSQR
jgi:hypothetical protein